MIKSMSPKNLKSDTVKVAWLVMATGAFIPFIELLAVWGIIPMEIKTNIQLTIPLLNVILGPLVMHFRANIKAKL